MTARVSEDFPEMNELADLRGKVRRAQAEADRYLAELALRTREAEELRRIASAKVMAADRLLDNVAQLKLAPVSIALIIPIPSCLLWDCRDNAEAPECGEVPSSPPSSISACREADVLAVRQTVESVLAQDYPRLDFVVAPIGTPGSKPGPSWLERIESRAIRILDPSAGPFEAIAKGFASSDADVLGWLEPGELLEPGAIDNVSEFFHENPRSAGAVFDDTADVGPWRLTRPRPRLDVGTLLSKAPTGALGYVSVFVRRKAYRNIGRLKTSQGRAAGWAFLLRFSRRHGFDRAGAHFACRRSQPAQSLLQPLHLWPQADQSSAEALAAWHHDLEAVRKSFESSYGTAGRVRGWLIRQELRLRDSFRRLLGDERLVFPLNSVESPTASTAPAPIAADRQPVEEAGSVSPLTRRRPARLIFSGPGARDGQRHAIYHDPRANLAYTLGPAHQPMLRPAIWPFAEYRPIHVWERHLINLPCPRPMLPSTSDPGNESERLLSLLSRLASPRSKELCFLHAGCGAGQLLEQLRHVVKWSLSGTEGRPQQAATARARGFHIWDADPFDAARLLPIGQSFDVIFLDERTLRTGDLVTTLRRLRQLLTLRGHIVLCGTNLGSRLLDLFGPTWPGWRVDRPLAVPGRQGVWQLALLADLGLMRFRTFTDVNACVTGIQQNRLRCVASPPPDPPTQEDCSRGRRLTAWANLLWDWRGMGDAYYAVLDQ